MLVRNGYGVLTIDSRGHGESDGTTNALGWHAYPDIIAAAKFLAARPEVDPARIGVTGVSMGAEIALDAAGHGAPVSAVVSDGAGGRSINEVLSLKRTWSDFIGLPTVMSINAVASVLTGSLPPPSIESQVGKLTTPVFFISSGRVAEERELNRIWVEKVQTTHQVWEVDAGHTEGLKHFPDEYERRVVAFFNEHLLGQ
jgi:pimeloyl-ACP methyl ester carboxylesterase